MLFEGLSKVHKLQQNSFITNKTYIMKKLTLILAFAFTMGLGISTVSAATKDKTAKDKTECCAKADKKACCSKDAKATCTKDAKTCPAKKVEEKK
jgi:hypothetical protein